MTLLAFPSFQLVLASAEVWQDEVALHLVMQPADEAAPPDIEYWGQQLVLEVYNENERLTELLRNAGTMGARVRLHSFHGYASEPISAGSVRLVARLGDEHTEMNLASVTA